MSAFPELRLGHAAPSNDTIMISLLDHDYSRDVWERYHRHNVTPETSNSVVLNLNAKRKERVLGPEDAIQKKNRQRQRKNMLQRVRRMAARSKSMKTTLKNLRKQKWLGVEATKTLCDLYASPAGKLIKNQVQNLKKSKNRRRYNEEIRSLALSIHYCSDAAYQVIR
jgi:hypothetical protein